MIVHSGNPLSPKVVVKLDGVEVNYNSIAKVVIDLAANKHDVVSLYIAGIPPKAITDYIDVAVSVTVTLGPGRTTEFRGYVLYLEPESISRSSVINNSPFQLTRVVCFGASLKMKGSKTRVWENASVVTIAKDMATTYGFSLDVFDDGFKLPRIVQAKQSDWEFLNTFCSTYGYSISVNATHMHIWDPFKAIGRRPSYEALTAPIRSSNPSPGSILKFNGTFGYLTPEGVSWNYSVDSIDNNGTINTSVGDHTDPEFSWSGVGHGSKYNSALRNSALSVSEGQKLVAAEIRKKLPFNAVVEANSTIGTVPGGIVNIEGYKTNFEGLWYVKEVKHTIGGSNCVTTLQLWVAKISRDFNTTSEYLVPPTELAENPPDSKYVNNRWQSSIERVSTYV